MIFYCASPRSLSRRRQLFEVDDRVDSMFNIGAKSQRFGRMSCAVFCSYVQRVDASGDPCAALSRFLFGDRYRDGGMGA